MKHFSHLSFPAIGLLCATLGATLAGCNRDSGEGGGMIASPGSSSDTLATVGTSKVTRRDLGSILEAQYGEQTLPLLIDTQLVFEALKAKSLDVTDAEVDADMARRQASDPQLAAQLAAGGLKIPIFKTQIKREIAIQKLLTQGMSATDAQVKSFFDKNRKYYDTSEKISVGMLLASTKVRADLMAAQLQKKTKTLAQLVAEQKKAADPAAGLSNEGQPVSALPPVIAQKVKPLLAKLPKGGLTPVQNFAGQAYGVFMVTDKTAPVKADFAKIRPDVEADFKSAEVAKKVVAKNPQNPPFDETLRRTFESLQAQNPAATLHDTLNYINQVAANELISGLRTAGTVQIDDANYAKVAAPYQSKTAAGTPGAATGNTAASNAATGNAATSNAATDNAAPAKP